VRKIKGLEKSALIPEIALPGENEKRGFRRVSESKSQAGKITD
jgi:hypothetical protein